MQLPGAMGNAWLLMQTECRRCRRSLATVLITPVASPDDVHADAVLGAVHHAVRQGGIDRSRIYLTSTSKGNEIALGLAATHSNVFAMAVLAGQVDLTSYKVTVALRKAPLDKLADVPGRRLTSLQFHIGDADAGWPGFWQEFPKLAQQFPKTGAHNPMIDVRLYLDAEHPVWFAAWNSLHDVLWLGKDPSPLSQVS